MKKLNSPMKGNVANLQKVARGVDLHQFDIERKPDPVFKPKPQRDLQSEEMRFKQPPFIADYDPQGNFRANTFISEETSEMLSMMDKHQQLLKETNALYRRRRNF